MPKFGERIPEHIAVYMELEGAIKDADCSVVEVTHGISSERGCCDLWNPVKGAPNFSCGTCVYLVKSKV